MRASDENRASVESLFQGGWCEQSITAKSDGLRRRYAPREDRGNCSFPEGISPQEGSCMSASRLRVYYGPEEAAGESTATATIPLRDEVTLPLGEVLPLLMDAVK